MTERELRRTAVIIPPKGRAVLCVWAAVPGLLAAPFVFWQGILPGLVFAALWAVLVFLARCRACSFAAVLGARTLTVYSGIVLPVRQVFPRRKKAATTAPGPAWVPMTLPMHTDSSVSVPFSHRGALSATYFCSRASLSPE